MGSEDRDTMDIILHGLWDFAIIVLSIIKETILFMVNDFKELFLKQKWFK